MFGYHEKLKVFISSKMQELMDVREYVEKALSDSGIQAWVYESHAGSRPESVTETSLTEVEDADVYLGIFWEKYGAVTVQEYQHARKLDKPCFIYIRDQNIKREEALEEFLRTEIYDLQKGVTYSYFKSAVKLGEQVATDILTWLVRRYRELTSKIKEAQGSLDETNRLRAEVDRLQSTSRDPLGTPIDYLAWQLKAWFETLGYSFESHNIQDEKNFEWIIRLQTRRGYDRILVRGVDGEAEVGDVIYLRQAVEETDTDEGWLVAARRKSQAASDEINKAGNKNLFCYTIDELLDEHADFSGYLNWLEEEVKRKGIDKMYVPLACSKEEFHPLTQKKIGESRYDSKNGWIDGYIDRWIDDPAKEHISILGEFGTGKTWFTLHYAWISLQRYRDAKERGIERPRLPLVIPLRDYAKAVSVESLFSEFFFRKHEIPLPGYTAFEQLNRMGKLLLIFDGFDEMAARINRQDMINNYWELARVVVPGAKVILTCRTEHFPEAKEGRALLTAKLQASTAVLTGRPPQFEVLELKQFDDAQIHQALSFRADSRTVNRIMSHPSLRDLARRPIMTELILEALPDVEAGKPVDLSRIYLYAVKRKMERDIKEERTFTSLADKIYFLSELSWEMLSTDRMSLNYRLFPERLRRLFGSIVQEQKDLDHWHYDMMGQTILIRNSDGDYTPAHRSLLEFFVAYKFAAQMGVLVDDFVELAREQSHLDPASEPRTYTWSTYFSREVSDDGVIRQIAPLRTFVRESFKELAVTVGKEPLASAILMLLEGMVNPRQLHVLIKATCGQTPDQVLYAGGNAATLINQLIGDFEGADIPGANLLGANLRHCDLSEVNLRGAILRDVNFKRAKLNGADFSFSDLTGATIWQCEAENTNFDSAKIPPQTILVFTGLWAMFLPAGSTLLDAAFSIHSQIGWHSTGGLINGRRANLSDLLPDRAKVWVETDRSTYTITTECKSFVNTNLGRHLVNRLLNRIADVGFFLIDELHKLDSSEAHTITEYDLHVKDDPWLCSLLLTSVFETYDADDRFAQYKDILEGRKDVKDVVQKMKECLDRYKQLREDLVEAKATQWYPRSVQRLFNLFDHYNCLELLKEYKVKTNEEVLIKILKNELDSRQIASIVAKERLRRRSQHN